MNSHVLVSRGWIENLITVAEENSLTIISPALIEGLLDYDFYAFADGAMVKMRDELRIGGRHAACLGVHESVWTEIAYFQPIPKLCSYEDTMFFHEVDRAGISIGMTGRSWLHHFGSITVSAMKQERGLSKKDGLGNGRNTGCCGKAGWSENGRNSEKRAQKSYGAHKR